MKKECAEAVGDRKIMKKKIKIWISAAVLVLCMVWIVRVIWLNQSTDFPRSEEHTSELQSP